MSLKLPQGMQINAPSCPASRPSSRPRRWPSSPTCIAPSSRAASSCWPRASSAPRASTPASGPTSSRRRAHIRDGDWKIAPLPPALECRRVEITGPVDAKMVINAFNSGADTYMTDFEDSNAPKWDNQIQGQINLAAAIRRTLSLEQNGKSYKLNDKHRHAAGASARLAPRREARAGRRPARVRRHLRLRACSCSTTRRSRSRAAPARTSTCPRWKAISRRACGTTSSCARRTSSACRRARSRRRC